jgi:hypothetical protein
VVKPGVYICESEWVHRRGRCCSQTWGCVKSLAVTLSIQSTLYRGRVRKNEPDHHPWGARCRRRTGARLFAQRFHGSKWVSCGRHRRSETPTSRMLRLEVLTRNDGDAYNYDQRMGFSPPRNPPARGLRRFLSGAAGPCLVPGEKKPQTFNC